MPTPRQPSFSGGELSPSLWGRTDLPRFGTGLRKAYNFFVSKHGLAISRPGSFFSGYASGAVANVGTTGTWPPISGGTAVNIVAGSAVRLIPFFYSDATTTTNVVLEFGAKYVAVRYLGSQVATVSGSIPYRDSDLQHIRYAQSGDILFLACIGYPPATITRAGPTTFAYATIDFSRPAPSTIDPAQSGMVDENSFGAGDTTGTKATKPWGWVVTELRRNPTTGVYYETAPLRLSGHVWAGNAWNPYITYSIQRVVQSSGLYFNSQVNSNLNNAPPASGNNTSWHQASTWSSSEPYMQNHWAYDAANFKWRVSKFDNNTNHAITDNAWWRDLGTGEWYQDDLSNTDVSVPLTQDSQALVFLPAPSTDPNFISYRVYRGRAGVYGWVFDAKTTAKDSGQDPDFTIAPPQGISPFLIKTQGQPDRYEYPNAVAFFEDRLAFAGTYERTTHFFASASGDYYNFDQRLIPADDESLVFALTARKREQVRALISGERALVFTDQSVWSVSGSGGEPLKPNSVEAHVHADIGTDWPQPLVVEGAVVWVRNKGTGVRMLQYDQNRISYQSQDLSFVADHLFGGRTIRDWCYQEDPWGLVWMVRDDGALLSLTYAPEEQSWAFAQHKVGGFLGAELGQAISVCTVPENQEDVLYIAIKGRPKAAWSSTATYQQGDAVTSGGSSYASVGASNLNHDPASDVTHTYWTPVDSSVANGPAWILRVGTRNELSSLVNTLDACTAQFGAYGAGPVAVTGLDRFEGKQVYARMSPTGEVQGPFTVTGGQVTLAQAQASNVNIAWVGLPYTCDLELLDLADARTRQKIVNTVGLELGIGVCLDGFGYVRAGQDFDHLAKLPVKASIGIINPTDSGLLKLQTAGDWKYSGRAALRVDIPIPVIVRGVTREVAVGG